MRIIIGFLLAPITGPLFIAVFGYLFGGLQEKYFLGFFLNIAIYSYLISFVVGIPAFLLFKSTNMKSVLSFILGGGIIALIPFVFLLNMSSKPFMLFLFCISVGIINGVSFWLMAIYKSNNTLKQTPQSGAA
jgi:hypothetical protein